MVTPKALSFSCRLSEKKQGLKKRKKKIIYKPLIFLWQSSHLSSFLISFFFFFFFYCNSCQSTQKINPEGVGPPLPLIWSLFCFIFNEIHSELIHQPCTSRLNVLITILPACHSKTVFKAIYLLKSAAKPLVIKPLI